jgi:hydrogenase maturation protease
MRRTLVAGFGNVLRKDDGFGVEVIRRLEEEGVGNGVTLLEVGTGGIRLAQELLTPYDRLIIVDAMNRGRPPGSVSVLAVDGVEQVREVDMHAAEPSRALALAHALGALPTEIVMVTCEPEETDDLSTELSGAVQAGVDQALAEIRKLTRA